MHGWIADGGAPNHARLNGKSRKDPISSTSTVPNNDTDSNGSLRDFGESDNEGSKGYRKGMQSAHIIAICETVLFVRSGLGLIQVSHSGSAS